jgi:hypothetical protein
VKFLTSHAKLRSGLSSVKPKYIAGFFMILLALSILLGYVSLIGEDAGEGISEFYFGVDAAYADIDEITELIDQVSAYTNIVLIGSTGVSHNASKLNKTCQYLWAKNLSFIVYDEHPFNLDKLNETVEMWRENFLGLQYEDEHGGGQLILYEWRSVSEADNYSDAANQFVNWISFYLEPRPWINYSGPAPVDFPLFTVDYALYWFDYKAGYDVVLAEFGWNHSRQLNVALCRGAATIQNRDWGVITTWTYTHPPYIESGAELYNDLVYAYENGAKYIMVFDTNHEYTESILRQEHFDAMKQFWDYTRANPRKNSQSGKGVAYVLPKDYAYGFRGPNDKIWGLWEADPLSLELSENLGGFLKQYGTRLDIIFDDGLRLDKTYSKYIFWNGTTYNP